MMEVTDMVNFRALCAAARNIRIVRATSQSADDPQFTEAWVELMRTAVAWREAAKARALARGGPEQQRPSFSPTPSKSDPKEVPSPGVYAHRLRWWASKLAWDRADGLPTDEASLELMRVACIGSTKSKTRRRGTCVKGLPSETHP